MSSRLEKNMPIQKEIDDEEKRRKWKKFISIFLKIFIPISLILIISFVSLRYIGTSGLVVKEYAIYSDKVNNDLDGLKIVHFGDINFNDVTNINKVKKVVNTIVKINPDVVIFTGDLISEDYVVNNDTKEELIDLFYTIDPKIGKYFVLGEKDKEVSKTILSSSGFSLLEKNEIIYLGSEKFNLVIDDKFDSSLFTIGVIHEINKNKDFLLNKDMVISGHNLNGSVRFPFFGRLFSDLKYIESHYKVNNTDLFITSGVGNNKYNFRLFNHPSINFFRIKKVLGN